MTHRRVAAFVLVAGLVAGCGSSKSTTSATSANAGKSGDPAKAVRTVEVHIAGGPRYDPSSMSVAAGETVTFKVVNDDSALHEFVLGNDKTQTDYEKTMRDMGNDRMTMADKDNLVELNGGQSKQLTWTFPTKKGTKVIFGSHQDGDYAAGLKGTITVG